MLMEQPDAVSDGSPVLVSACLLGLGTRYDGGHCLTPELPRQARRGVFVPVCPEQLGGLPTPRPRAEIERGGGGDVLDGNARVRTPEGTDVTGAFLRGARMVCSLADLLGARAAVLKEGSPSCGVCRIRRDGAPMAGRGVTAALLTRKGLRLDGVE